MDGLVFGEPSNRPRY